MNNERKIELQSRIIELQKKKMRHYEGKIGKRVKLFTNVEADPVTKLLADRYEE